MEIVAIIRFICLGASFGTLCLSLIFLLFPDLYLRIEEIVDLELISETDFFTTLEGKINFLNDWIFKNRIFFGILFVLLSFYNIKSLIVL